MAYGLHGSNGAFNTNVNEYPDGATQVSASSGNVAAGTAAASLPAVAGRTNYITGFTISGAGATLGLAVSVTVVGVLSGTLTYTYTAIAGVLLANQSLNVSFPYPLAASAVNTAITVSCPTLGIGNTNNTVNVYGYVK